MTIRSAIATILGCTMLLAGVGVSVGYLLGEFMPEYYRTVFHRGREPGFDPVRVGIGQGLTQGLIAGVVLGIALVAIFCWREVRRASLVSPRSDENAIGNGKNPPAFAKSLARRLLFVAGVLLAAGFCSCCALVLGLLGGERGAYHRRYLEERNAVAPILAGDPAFAGVELHEYSAGGVYLTGEVLNKTDFGRLQSRVEQAIRALAALKNR